MNEIIQNIKNNLQATPFQLNTESLGSEQLVTQIQQAFPDETLELIPDKDTIKEQEDSLHFQATAVEFLGVYEQPVKVVFLILDNQLECLITATLPDYWDFSWGYPFLPDYTNYANTSLENNSSFFYDFHYSKPVQILFCSCDYQKYPSSKDKLALIDSSINDTKIQQGLNYLSEIDLNKISFFGVLSEFFEIQKTSLPFHGYLKQDEQIELAVELDVEAKRDKTYKEIFSIKLSSLVFYSDIFFYSIPAQSGIVLRVELTIGKTQPTQIEVIWPIGSKDLIIKNASPFPFPEFEVFKDLLKRHLPEDNDKFPLSENDLGTLYIEEIVLHLSLDSPAITHISLTVATPKTWNYSILNQAIVLEELLFNWQISFGNKNNISFELMSAFRVGGGLVSVGARYPDFVFYGELALYEKIELKQIFAHFLPNAPLPEVDILDLAITADIKQEEYTLELDIASDWEIQLGSAKVLPLKYLQINIEKDSDSIFATIDSVLNIAGVDIILLAMHCNERGTSGWTFSGSTRPGQEIPINTLVTKFSTTFGVSQELPTAIKTLVIENLSADFNTATKDFKFGCEAKFSLGQKDIDILLAIAITRNHNEEFQKHFGGKIAIGELDFSLSFDSDPNSKTFIATYNNPTGKSQSIKQLVANISETIAESIPDGFTITLKDALFAYSNITTKETKTDEETKNEETKLLFILHIDSGINLSNLPLVGKFFPANQTIQLHYQLLAASHYFSKTDVTNLNTLVTNGISQLPEQAIGSENEPSKSNFGLAVTLQLGNVLEQLNLPISLDSNPSTTSKTDKKNDDNNSQSSDTDKKHDNNLSISSNSTKPSISPDKSLTTSEGIKWYQLHKSFGPVHFQKIGVKCQGEELWFFLDASLTTAGLTVSLDGLALSSPLTKLEPKFHLNGMGIDYRNSAIEIGGAFLKTSDDEYRGTAILRTKTKGKQLTLSALGSYTYYKGHPSLFIYAFLDFPLGGPPFLFVTGLAAGFGYNRTLRLPEKLEDIAQFPLVKFAIEDTEKSDLTEVLESLSSYITPATGEHFFAIGIKFTSFKIIDSFALLTVQLGSRSEINILGLSTLIAPPNFSEEKIVEPVAKAELALRATFLPEEGFLKVDATLLPGAYLFSNKCHLSGRFAFYSWFSGEHQGDFVLSLGGYHPDFDIPKHYPKLPRLQLKWQLDKKTSIKGDAYFALCSHALMAGGHLELNYESGNVKAWLKTGADFLIAWKPYHDDAHIYVTIGASYTFQVSLLLKTVTKHITAQVGADLHLWGPDFGGTATIHLYVVQVNIDFGNSSARQPKPIDWKTFKASFLPNDEEVCSIAVQNGLVRKIDNDKSSLGVINPKHFSLVTNSVIPIKQAYKQEESSQQEIKISGTKANFGIGSMAVLSEDLKTEHRITITKDGTNVEDKFQYEPIFKKVPIGLWGEPPSREKPLTPSVNGEKFIENALSGFEIKPHQTENAGQSYAVDRAYLQSEPEYAPNSYDWKHQTPFKVSKEGNHRTQIRDTVTQNSKRTSLLQSLGFNPEEDVDLSEAIADDFIFAPQVKA